MLKEKFSNGNANPKNRTLFLIYLVIILIIIVPNLLYGSKEDNIKDTNEEFYFYGFHNDLVSNLNNFYAENGESEGKEFSVCLKGYVDGNKVYINNYSKYKVGSETSTVDDKDNLPFTDYCDGKEEIGFLHKHPSNNPIPSYEDIIYFLNSFKYHNNTISIIMYDYNGFEIFTEKNYLYKLNCPNCPEELIRLWEEI